MVKKFNIHQKIQVYILGSTILVYMLVIGYISITMRSREYKQSTQMIEALSAKYAAQIGGALNEKMNALRALARSFETLNDFSDNRWFETKSRMLQNVFSQQKDLFKLWDSWEYSYIRQGWDKPYGRTAQTVKYVNGQILSEVSERSLTGDPVNYGHCKSVAKEFAWEPYVETTSTGAIEDRLMSTLSVPIKVNDKFVGIVAEDIRLKEFQQLLEKIKPYEDAEAELISAKGVIAGHPDKQHINKRFADEIESEEGINIEEKINSGTTFSFTAVNHEGVKCLYTFSPIKIGNDGVCTWAMGISVPVSTINKQANSNFIIYVLLALAGLAVILTISNYLAKSITNPIRRITQHLKRMSEGELSEDIKVESSSQDEIGEMETALNTTIDGLMVKSTFAKEIGAGNLSMPFKLISSRDVLGKSLLSMREDLNNAHLQEQAQKKEEEIRSWLANGLADINDKMRQNNSDLKELCRIMIRTIVGYLNANQGGIFIHNNREGNELAYEQMATIAYNREKLTHRSFKPNEGVLGTCVTEKEHIYLKELPNNYISITSGLGGANPSSLIIVPMIHDNVVVGVIEIASFTEFEEHHKEFIFKAAEGMASTINSVRTAAMTQKLLEDSQMVSEQLQAQEEEMRQNLEELRSTQEEMSRQSTNLELFFNALNKTSYFVEYDTNGYVINISETYANHLGYTKEEATQINLKNDFKSKELDEKVYEQLLKKLRNNEVVKIVLNRKNKQGQTHTFVDHFAPIIYNGELTKFMKVTIDVTSVKNTNITELGIWDN